MNKSNPAVDTALAGILEVQSDWNMSIPKRVAALRAILEALVEDVEANANLTREVRP